MTDLIASRNLHSKHSHMVRDLRKSIPGGLQSRSWDVSAERHHTLVSPGKGHHVSVSFSEVEGHPDHVLIRSSNWRCEHEPKGWAPRTAARSIYQQLKAAGFIQQEKQA